ncbi:hypothetical protein ACQP3J_30310, partial [Escherichia coli]
DYGDEHLNESWGPEWKLPHRDRKGSRPETSRSASAYRRRATELTAKPSYKSRNSRVVQFYFFVKINHLSQCQTPANHHKNKQTCVLEQ